MASKHNASESEQQTGTSVSVVERTRDAVIEYIGAERFTPGDRLPAERELAERLSVSRTTLREALAQLDRSGYVTRRPGRGGGTFVSQPKVERDLTALHGLPEHLRRQGRTASARVLSARLLPSDGSTAAALQITAGAMVYEIIRLRLADGEPISLERSRFPADRFDGLLEHALGGSLYDILREGYGVGPHRAQERIEPVAAGPIEASVLAVAEGQPMLSVERVTYDEDGTPIEVGHDIFRGDRTRIVVWVGTAKDAPLEVRTGAPS